MNNTDKLLPRERVCLMNAIAERDKLISEKDRLIAHYRRQYEIAVKRRLHERHERSDKWKDRLTGAVLAIAAAGMVWLTLDALKEFVLWASGM